jgi:hypothetical protein
MSRYSLLPFAILMVVVLLAEPNQCAAGPIPSTYTLSLQPFTMHTGQKAMQVASPRDNTGNVYVATQSGQVFRYSATGQSLGTFLDLPTALPGFVYGSNTFTGLMYMAFHPDYARVGTAGYGRVYTAQRVTSTSGTPNYHARDFGSTAPKEFQMSISEWRYNPFLGRLDPNTRREVMRLGFQPDSPGTADAHALGMIAFNPRAGIGDADYGNLYVAVGDSNDGNGVSPRINLQMVQNLDNPFGKILRINPLQAGNSPYSVPASNPWADGGVVGDADGRAEEVFAVGFRDPQTFTFGPGRSGESLLVAFEIGAGGREEVTLVRPGSNHGWSRFEGTVSYNPSITMTAPHTPPALEYDHGAYPAYPGGPTRAGGAAIIGGLVVSEPGNPAFQDQVIFSDLVRGSVFHADYSALLSAEATGSTIEPKTLTVQWDAARGSFADVIGASRGDLRFGYDQAGSVYFVSKQTQTVFKTSLVVSNNPFVAGLLGDVNLDGLVQGDGTGDPSIDDFAAFRAGWSQSLAGFSNRDRWLLGDLDQDGTHSLLDFAILRRGLGPGAPATLWAEVPEPSAALLVGTALLPLAAPRRLPQQRRMDHWHSTQRAA